MAGRGRSKDLGERLRRCRDAHGYSLRQVAQLSGLSTEAVSAVERGTRYPSLDTLERLAMALNVTIVVGPRRTEIFDG